MSLRGYPTDGFTRIIAFCVPVITGPDKGVDIEKNFNILRAFNKNISFLHAGAYLNRKWVFALINRWQNPDFRRK